MAFRRGFGRNSITMKRHQQWKDALRQASCLQRLEGELLKDLVAKIVEEIQEKIAEEIQDRILSEDEYGAVGLEERVHDVGELFHLEEKRKVYFVLLWGMGGIGKTTLARAIYKRLRTEFEASSFVENCADVPTRIQDRLLNDLLLENDFPGDDVEKRRERLKFGLRKKKVFIILDDVKSFDSMKEVIDLRYLHPGSRILVTSRNQTVFPDKNDFSDFFRGERYQLQGWEDDESLQLFSLHAFGKNAPDLGFETLAMRVIQACGGLPLSLEVLGRYLWKKEKKFWEEALTLLRSSKYQGISERLRISYEALAKGEKEMFLDVACFLIGEHKHSAKYFWDGLVEGWRGGLRRLVDLSLVKVGKDEHLTMHDYLRDLGRGIAQKEYKNSGKWSRLWDDPDTLSQVLTSMQGLDQIRGLATSLPNLNTVYLSQMRSLRLLFLNGTHLDGDGEGLKGLKIRWLKWSNFRGETLPKELDLEFLTVLELESYADPWSSNANIQLKTLRKLPPSFAQLKQLRKLDMSHCYRLGKLPEDFGSLESLEVLAVRGSAITKLPSSFGQLKKLRELDMDGCNRLGNLPKDFGTLENLEVLGVRGSAISKLPSSFGQLKRLRKLGMDGCGRLKELPEDFGSLESLEELDLTDTAITELPSSFRQLRKIRKLEMAGCDQLEELPEDFGSLESLEELSLPEDFGSRESFKQLSLSSSAITKPPPSFGQLKKLRKLDMDECHKKMLRLMVRRASFLSWAVEKAQEKDSFLQAAKRAMYEAQEKEATAYGKAPFLLGKR